MDRVQYSCTDTRESYYFIKDNTALKSVNNKHLISECELVNIEESKM